MLRCVLWWGKQCTHFYWFLFRASLRMCVQGEKKNELSNKSKQSNNNERFSLKVPRADWVSILNLKTRLSQCKLLFTIDIFYKGVFCGGFSNCPKYRHFSICQNKILKSNCNFQFWTCYVRLMCKVQSKTIAFKRI